jgi:hypothetical protein
VAGLPEPAPSADQEPPSSDLAAQRARLAQVADGATG